MFKCVIQFVVDNINMSSYYYDNNNLTAYMEKKRGMKMGTLVCKDCNETISYFDNEKVTVLYGKCEQCQCNQDNKEKSM